MKIKITRIGRPIGVVSGQAGFSVDFEYNGKRTAAFLMPGDDLKSTLYKEVSKEELRQKMIVEAAKFAEKVKKLIGIEIDVP